MSLVWDLLGLDRSISLTAVVQLGIDYYSDLLDSLPKAGG